MEKSYGIGDEQRVFPQMMRKYWEYLKERSSSRNALFLEDLFGEEENWDYASEAVVRVRISRCLKQIREKAMTNMELIGNIMDVLRSSDEN